jgi:hypothetical protein
MFMKYGLSENVQGIIKSVFEKQPKIDLMLEGDQLRLEDLLEIMVQLDNLALPYKFDISIRHSIQNDALIEHIERVGITFYRKD